jgi:Ca2+/Na+ antiporter
MKKWLEDKFRETLNQTFTLLGMFIAWAVLDGSAKTVVGWAVVICTIVWLFSMKFREQEEEKNDKE